MCPRNPRPRFIIMNRVTGAAETRLDVEGTGLMTADWKSVTGNSRPHGTADGLRLAEILGLGIGVWSLRFPRPARAQLVTRNSFLPPSSFIPSRVHWAGRVSSCVTVSLPFAASSLTESLKRLASPIIPSLIPLEATWAVMHWLRRMAPA